MSMRQLYDPILNDILLLVQGRKHQALSPMAVTRYQQHLDRLDVELRAARVKSKKPALAYGDTQVAVASSTLGDLHKRIADLTGEVRTAQAAVAQALSEHPEIARLADFLLQELDPRHFTGLEGSAVD